MNAMILRSIAENFASGAREAGADVEIIFLAKKEIGECLACMNCWTKTPGRCPHKDDMTEEIFPKWLKADLVVYATPLYYHTMNGVMSIFLERTLPAIQPFFEKADDGKISHPVRFKIPAAIWLSVCGFPDESTPRCVFAVFFVFNYVGWYVNNHCSP